MQQRGLLDEQSVRASLAQPLPAPPERARVRAPYFVDVVREEIDRRLVLPDAGEVRISTTIDPTLQHTAERSLREGLGRIEKRQSRSSGRGRLDGAVVAIEPATGYIRALVGGRRYPESPFNRATRALRQPGSLFKPLVYLTAFEVGLPGQRSTITPASLILDEPLTVRAGDEAWTPKNMDRRLLGSVTVRRALEESRNVPAVRLALDVGLKRVVDMAQRLGIESALAAVPSLALGTSEVTLLEITAAYAALANGGARTQPTTLTGAVDHGGVRFREPVPAPTQVVSAESAYLVTHLLRGVMQQGTGQASRRWGLSEVTAGKTGSTDGLRDAWFVGYTPDLVVGVWVGRDDGSPLGMSGAEAALPIWATTMAAAVGRARPRPFTPPAGVVMVPVDRDTGRPPSFWCERGAMVEEAFRAGTEPRSGCDENLVAASGRRLLGWFQDLLSLKASREAAQSNPTPEGSGR
jgi:penicillin-binding protein 1B